MTEHPFPKCKKCPGFGRTSTQLVTAARCRMRCKVGIRSQWRCLWNPVQRGNQGQPAPGTQMEPEVSFSEESQKEEVLGTVSYGFDRAWQSVTECDQYWPQISKLRWPSDREGRRATKNAQGSSPMISSTNTQDLSIVTWVHCDFSGTLLCCGQGQNSDHSSSSSLPEPQKLPGFSPWLFPALQAPGCSSCV